MAASSLDPTAIAKTLLLTLSAICLLGPIGTTDGQGASFDCAKARKGLETTICQSRPLSALDETMASTYQQAIARAKDPKAVVRDQQAWLKTRRDDATALVQEYERRIAVLAHRRDYPDVDFHDPLLGVYGEMRDICLVQEGCVGRNLSTITLLAVDEAQSRLVAELLFANAHICTFDAIGTWQGNALYFKEEGNGDTPEGSTNQNCELIARFDQQRVTLQANQACQYYCGARGSLNGQSLPRWQTLRGQ